MRWAPLLAALALLLPVTASAADRTYIVMLDGAPGNVARQRAALQHVSGSPDVLYSYRDAFPGFAARLTASQRAQLARAPQVAHVFRNRKRTLQSVASDEDALDAASGFGDTPASLGLPARLWSTLGGSEHAGDDVVVGVLDSGITPQHPSFSGDGYGAPPAGFTPSCETASDPSPQGFCNAKLIGARFFVEGFGAAHLKAGSFLSPRDDDGHGTHVASSAAGDFGVDPSVFGNDLGVNRISGVAPRARVAAYKVCWVGGDTDDGCTDADSVAAVDAAVADGVDVLNYSVGNSGSTVIDPVSLAFLGAEKAGVYVAVSGGNDGPDPASVETPSTVPWVTSVAADASARTFTATASIASASGTFTVTGASVTPAITTPAALTDGGLCLPGSLNGVSGKVVVCRRGTNDRVEKSRVVRDAGGVGMVLANADPTESLDTDTHFVPTIHVTEADGDRLLAALPATVTFTKGTASRNDARGIAVFSSRGPQTAVPDLAKPDLAAPGVTILGANAPDPVSGLRGGELYQAISGTSMAAPHVAGAAALVHQQHPGWSPSAIKSALMMTARPVPGASPFDAGSGEIDPTAAGAAGLVMTETAARYAAYVHDALAPSDLNLPSIANGAVAGTFATKRTFTSTAATARHWTIAFAVPGFTASAPAAIDVAPGQRVTVPVSVKRTTARLDRYAFGSLTLRSKGQTLHLPVSLDPIALRVDDPLVVTARRSKGSFPIAFRSGAAARLSAHGTGFAAPDVLEDQTIAKSPTGDPSPTAGPGVNVTDVEVPKGTKLLSARLGDATAGSDLDLYVYRDGRPVGSSVTVGSDEVVDLLDPAPGTYRIAVVGFTTADPVSTYDLSTYEVDRDATGFEVTGDPLRVGIGDAGTLTGEWSGLDAADLYLGVATFSTGAERVVELAKVADTPKPVLRVLDAELVRHRVLRLRVRLDRRARVGLRVTRRGHRRAKAAPRVIGKGRHRVRYRLTHRLRAHRHYRVVFALNARGRRARAAIRIRVSR